jgi:hypothetical protein
MNLSLPQLSAVYYIYNRTRLEATFTLAQYEGREFPKVERFLGL